MRWLEMRKNISWHFWWWKFKLKIFPGFKFKAYDIIKLRISLIPEWFFTTFNPKSLQGTSFEVYYIQDETNSWSKAIKVKKAIAIKNKRDGGEKGEVYPFSPNNLLLEVAIWEVLKWKHSKTLFIGCTHISKSD